VFLDDYWHRCIGPLRSFAFRCGSLLVFWAFGFGGLEMAARPKPGTLGHAPWGFCKGILVGWLACPCPRAHAHARVPMPACSCPRAHARVPMPMPACPCPCPRAHARVPMPACPCPRAPENIKPSHSWEGWRFYSGLALGTIRKGSIRSEDYLPSRWRLS
jgi:hypothetical protein